jgi:hypothetical protein
MQTKESININEGKEKMKDFWKKFQRKKWKQDSINALWWSFYCVNENKLVDVKCYQLMRCILCYVNMILITHAKTQARKSLILYSTTNGIIAKKTCLCIPLYDCKNIWNNFMKKKMQRKCFM